MKHRENGDLPLFDVPIKEVDSRVTVMRLWFGTSRDISELWEKTDTSGAATLEEDGGRSG